jgi:large subunit ribosomal protein L23
VKSTTRDARAVILAPVVSEKSYALLEDGKYSFRVHPDAHKTQIRQAIEELFSVRVVDVKVIKVPPKPKRRGIHRGTRPGYKKAIVRVAEGQTIPVFEGVA